jgi:hypothetical protein
MGRPHALLWEGLLAWLSHRPKLAFRRWNQAVDWAMRLRTPYILGRAHLEIGRHLQTDEPARIRHLEEALVVFERLGCATELAWTRDELARSVAM